MKKTIAAVLLMAFSNVYFSQVGIRTSAPDATLDVVGKPTVTNAPDGVIAPRLTGNQLKAKDNVYGTKQTGTIVYATSAASPTSAKTMNVSEAGYYYFDGSVWVSFNKRVVNDATRYLGGTVYAYFNEPTGGVLSLSRVIGGGNSSYNLNYISQTSTRGGVMRLAGNGYKISNPKNGIFDIQFDVPLTEIYGISVNILDSYGYNNGDQQTTMVSNGAIPLVYEPGSRLFTNDNAQVSYLSNGIIRIKTGDSNGKLANRSFTFLVTGL
ncbi:hypothetical protein [Chryseobacterium sp.]|uniref:hypothetical protein n=1 Tax=Chryseobacterium sp. TaxID=1871047 RepID=UPI002897ED88|nr:hypothetical protein [Chryseobacterium sp.]